jgi:hypothetical protein
MKRLLAAAVFMTLVFVSPWSLAENDRAARFEQRMEETKARLNLSEEQLDQMAPLLEESMEAQRRILSSYGIDLERRSGSAGRLGLRQARAMRQELETVRVDMLNELEAILNDEQLDEFKRMQQERKAEMRDRIRGGESRHSQWPTAPATDRGLARFM